MGRHAAELARRDSLPPGVTRVGGSSDYTVAVWRNVMILHVAGEIDAVFLKSALSGHHAALQFHPAGYGVVVMVEPSARIPRADLRDEAGRLRQKTQHHLRAQSVLIGGEGFFASTMRAVITGIMAVAQSRVPTKMVGGELDAALFVHEKACDPQSRIEELHAALVGMRAFL